MSVLPPKFSFCPLYVTSEFFSKTFIVLPLPQDLPTKCSLDVHSQSPPFYLNIFIHCPTDYFTFFLLPKISLSAQNWFPHVTLLSPRDYLKFSLQILLTCPLFITSFFLQNVHSLLLGFSQVLPPKFSPPVHFCPPHFYSKIFILSPTDYIKFYPQDFPSCTILPPSLP